MSQPVSATHVKALRAFNRFYTQRIGVLDPYLGSELSLTEVRVVYELAHREQSTASALLRELALDGGYLSRILRRFESRGWLYKSPSPADARQSLLTLTEAGHQAFAPLQQKSRDEASRLLAALAPEQQRALIDAMATVRRLLEPDSANAPLPTALLREHKPGDIGWIIQLHAETYAREHGWDSSFEAMVADIGATFLKKYQPDWDRCWIAELHGERVGSVMVVRQSATIARLRLLILSTGARGLGLGARLTDEAITFARAKGYRKMVLWTHSCLTAARDLYARRGFVLTQSEAYRAFGHDLVSETWELKL